MRRKVIQIADSTQLISLPRKWALKHGIKKGDELDIEEKGSKLNITVENKEQKKEIEINITGMDRDSVIYTLRAVYTQGFDVIDLIFDSAQIDDFRRKKKTNVVDVINQEVARLNGVEIFSQSKNRVAVKSISIDTVREFDNLYNRILFLLNETLNDFIEGYESANEDLLRNIEAKHDLISKFVYYCERILSKGVYSDVNKTKNYTTMLNYLDLCMDSIKYSARFILLEPHKPSKQTIALLKSIAEEFSLFIKMLKKFSLDELRNLSKRLIATLQEYSKSMGKEASTELKVLSYMNIFVENFRFLLFNVVKIYYADKHDKTYS